MGMANAKAARTKYVLATGVVACILLAMVARFLPAEFLSFVAGVATGIVLSMVFFRIALFQKD